MGMSQKKRTELKVQPVFTFIYLYYLRL